jgi:hypothetical protein
LPDLLLLLLLLKRKSSDNTLHHPTTLSLGGVVAKQKPKTRETKFSLLIQGSFSILSTTKSHPRNIMQKQFFGGSSGVNGHRELCLLVFARWLCEKQVLFLGGVGSFVVFFECLKECCFSHESSHPTQEDGRMPN